jgi:ABC-2 type transport system permease protein
MAMIRVEVFNPIHDLPPLLAVLSALSPMRYAVELIWNVHYGTQAGLVALATSPIALNVVVIAASFLGFIVIGAALFVRSERNR